MQNIQDLNFSSGLPGMPKLSHNNWGNGNSYIVTMNMWYGNNGTSWNLYENGKLVCQQELVDNSPGAQSAAKSFTNKEIGVYIYKCELVNSFGTAVSEEIKVNVGDIHDGGAIRIGGLDSDGQAVLQFTIPQGSSEYLLTLNEPIVPVFTIETNNGAVLNYELINGNVLRIKGMKQGRASIKISEQKSGRVRYVGVRVKSGDNKLPGMPEYLSIGSVSEDTSGDLAFWREFRSDLANKRMDIRYIYLNGGPTKGWRTWTDRDGARAETFIAESLKLGMLPFFVYYNIPDNDEGYAIDRQHIENEIYMQGYFKDLKFALDIVNNTAKDEVVGFVLEPDFLGYMMQNSGVSPKRIPAKTSAAYSSGVLKSAVDPKFPDTIEGLVKAINYTISKYSPTAFFGWQFNLWASNGVTTPIPGTGIIHLTDTLGIEKGRTAISDEAREIAKYYMEAGITSYGAKFVSIDKYGYDAGSASPADPVQSKWFWNADHWNNYLLFADTLHKETKLPVVFWQLPVGHINSSLMVNPYDASGKFPDLTNTARNYEDSAPTFFLGDTFSTAGGRAAYFAANSGRDPKITTEGGKIIWGSHIAEAVNHGVVAILFGAGVNDSTDGVGSPPSDNYWWITKVQQYLKNPVLLSNPKGEK